MSPPLSSEMTSFVLVSTDGEQLVVDDADVVAAVSTEVQAESIAMLIVAVACCTASQCCTLPIINISM